MRYTCFHVVGEDFITFCEGCFCLAVHIFLDFWLAWCWWRYWDFVRVLVHTWFVWEACVIRSLIWNLCTTVFLHICRQVRASFDLRVERQFNCLTAIGFHLFLCKRQGNGLTVYLDLASLKRLTIQFST